MSVDCVCDEAVVVDHSAESSLNTCFVQIGIEKSKDCSEPK